MILTKAAGVLGVMLLLSCTGQNGRNMAVHESKGVPGEDASKQADILFDTLIHDFGTIIEGEMVGCYFDYTNSGEGELIITKVETSCGCTSPDWNREPLKPGEREQLEVVFDSRGRSGSQRKSVTVVSNAAGPAVRLSIVANVINNK